MVKRLFFLLLFCLPAKLFAQNQLVLKTYVYKGKTYVRWVPANIQLLETALKNGYTLEKVKGSKIPEFDQQSKQTIVVPSPYASLDSMVAAKKQISQDLMLLEAFRNPQSNEKIKKQAFAYLILGVGYNRTLALGAGLLHIEEYTGPAMYRVKINGTKVTSSIITAEDQNVAPKKIILEKIEARKKSATMHWEAQSISKDYSAYFIERSENNIDFKRLNSLPLVFLKSQYEKDKTDFYHEDTTVERGKKYYYRITGISHFTEEYSTSEVQEVYIKKAFDAYVQLDTVTYKGNIKNITVGFEFTDHSQLANVSHLLLQTSKSPVKDFVTIMEQKATGETTVIFTDTTARNRVNYRAALVSVDNDTVFSLPYYFFFNDAIPPAVPINLKGIVDSSGTVKLEWAMNTENDFKGYKIYRCNALNEEFVEITKEMVSTSYFSEKINLNNLDSLIYYRVVAVDSSFNHSQPSAHIKLQKPDKIPPVAAVISGLRSTKAGLILSWKNSTSADVRHTKLVRLWGGKQELIKTLLPGDTTGTFVDSLIQAGGTYKYELITIDRSGNVASVVSPSQTWEPGFRKALVNIEAIASINKKQIELKWEKPNEKVYQYHVYRAKNNEPFILLKTIGPDKELYNDTDLNINNVYQYKVKAVFESGVHSLMTKPVKVVY